MPLTSAQINELKTRINNEMVRRMNPSSVHTDGPLTNPAFAVTPSPGSYIYAQQGTASIGVLAQMNNVGAIPRRGGNMVAGELIPKEFDYSTLSNFISNLNSKATTAPAGLANTGCAASCTGLCAGTCYSSCTGNFTYNFSYNFYYNFYYAFYSHQCNVFSSGGGGGGFYSFYDFQFGSSFSGCYANCFYSGGFYQFTSGYTPSFSYSFYS